MKMYIYAFAFLLSPFALCCGWSQAATDDPIALAKRIVASHGGAERLLRILSFDETYVLGTSGKPTDRKSVLQPPLLWFVGKTERVSQENKGAICQDVWMWTLGPLVDPRTKLESIPSSTIDGKDAKGLKVSGSVDPALEVFFDPSTSDLLKIAWKGEQFLFSAPVDVDGTRVPSKCTLIGKTGNLRVTTELKKIDRLAALPEGLNKP